MAVRRKKQVKESVQDGVLLLFKTIFEQTPLSTQIFTPNGETLMVNNAWEKLWNIKFDQLESYNILKDKQLVETGIMPYVKRGFKGQVVALPAIKYDPSKSAPVKGARIRWLSARMYPIKNEKGVITHLVLQHEDITDKRLSDRALKMSEERFRTLTRHAPVGIFLTDKLGNCLFVNERWCKLAGMNEKKAMGSGWADALHPEDKERVFKAWYIFAKTGKEFNMEYRFISPKGKVVWLSGSAVALHDAKKNVTGYMGTIVEITDRKKALDSLENSEERLRLALDAGRIGVWDWNIKENLLAWTDNVYHIHGVSRGSFKVTLDNFQKLIYPDDKKRVLGLIEKSLTKGEEFNVEFRIITPKGEVRWVETRAIISYGKEKEPVRMLGATTDISQKKQLEQDKNDFLSMASHELKTPLTSMKMFIELLHKQLENGVSEKQPYFVSRIRDQANRLSELTNDLLDVSRIETGKLQLNKQMFNLYDLIVDTVEGLQATTTKHKLIIKDDKDISVLADRYRIYQVLVNLIINAIKYSPHGKKVIVTVVKNKQEAVVSVKDFGIGITKEKQEKIFDRLYQVADPHEKTFPGLGLGLYISKEIVERHGGKIWVQSKKSVGSTFYFTIPLAKKTK